jgi:hypothetical protein
LKPRISSCASRLTRPRPARTQVNTPQELGSLDLFVVPTGSFKLLYGLVILRHARRRLVSVDVSFIPTAQWIAGQVTDAFPWDEAPRYLIRDRDCAYGHAYTRRVRALAIRDGITITARPKGRRKTATKHWRRTRADPFAESWPPVESWLVAEPNITAKELMVRLTSSFPISIPRARNSGACSDA